MIHPPSRRSWLIPIVAAVLFLAGIGAVIFIGTAALLSGLAD